MGMTTRGRCHGSHNGHRQEKVLGASASGSMLLRDHWIPLPTDPWGPLGDVSFNDRTAGGLYGLCSRHEGIVLQTGPELGL